MVGVRANIGNQNSHFESAFQLVRLVLDVASGFRFAYSDCDQILASNDGEKNVKLESIALHHGYESEATTKAAAVPIYQTTSYTFDDTQHGADLFNLAVEGNIYSRIMNPTNAVLE